MLNTVILIGRLVADPDMRTTQTGKAVCCFTLAVDRQYRNADGSRSTDFVDIVAWGKTGELAGSYLCKGKLAAITGQLQSRRWEDKEGRKRISWEVNAEYVTFLSPKDKDADSKPWNEAPAGDDDLYSPTDDDLPC